MKKSLLIILIIFSANCFGQNPDPNLFQTWYLNSMRLSDGDALFNISAINPQISPTLTISQNMQFSGTAACNSFTGVLSISDFNYLQSTSFSNSTLDCTTPEHDYFESDYFQLFQLGGSYQIIPVEGGLLLTISTYVFGGAEFYNFPLNTETFTPETMSLYPNPCQSEIALSSKSAIDKVEIFNLLGQNCKSVFDNFQKIDVSELETGTYILRIYNENGIANKKMIKN